MELLSTCTGSLCKFTVVSYHVVNASSPDSENRFFGYGMCAVGLTALPVTTMTYVSDCYLPVNMDAFLLINGLKNIVAFGFLYGVVPWVEEVGYIDCFGTQAGVYELIILLVIPLILFGKRLRHITAGWRIII
jgi:hypothetical protein